VLRLDVFDNEPDVVSSHHVTDPVIDTEPLNVPPPDAPDTKVTCRPPDLPCTISTTRTGPPSLLTDAVTLSRPPLADAEPPTASCVGPAGACTCVAGGSAVGTWTCVVRGSAVGSGAWVNTTVRVVRGSV